MNVAQAMVRIWEETGVKYAFGIPGEETLDLVDALKDSKIEFIVTRHEQGAAFMAATYGRFTGVPALCITTLGPGATNTLTSMAYAKLGQMPMILISGQKPIHQVKQGYFQMVDVLATTEPLSYFSQRVTIPGSASSLAMQSYHAAKTNYGPVHLELPEDIAAETVSEHTMRIRYPRPLPVNASETSLKNATQHIEQASAPLLILGQGANDDQVSHALACLINKTNIPFITTQMGKGAVDESSKYYIGTTTLSGHDFVHQAINASDLLIMVGHNHAEKPPFLACCGTKDVLHIDRQPAFFNEVYVPSCTVVGDIVNSVEEITALIQPQKSWEFKDFYMAKDAFEAHENELAASDCNTPFQIVQQVRKAMPNDGIVLLDNGMYKIWFSRHYRALEPNTLLLDNALATMGAGLPSAIAASILYPQKHILALCGDGGFLMNGQELETATRLGLNLIALIVKDNAYGMIRWKQQIGHFEEYAMEFNNPDFVKLAESYHATGHHVEKVSELAGTIQQAHTQGGVHVIEIPIDYSENEILNHLPDITRKPMG